MVFSTEQCLSSSRACCWASTSQENINGSLSSQLLYCLPLNIVTRARCKRVIITLRTNSLAVLPVACYCAWCLELQIYLFAGYQWDKSALHVLSPGQHQIGLNKQSNLLGLRGNTFNCQRPCSNSCVFQGFGQEKHTKGLPECLL